MELKEKLEYAVEKGFTGNIETGIITSFTGRIIKGKNKDGYINFTFVLNKKFISIRANIFIWYLATGEVPTKMIDHINTIKTDNRIINLRELTRQQNGFNRGAKGYSYNKLAKKYKSTIVLNKKNIHLGYFDTPEDAHQAYIDAKKIYHKIDT